MNEKGFLQVYIMFLLLIILLSVQLLNSRYSTIVQYQTTSKDAYYCEMYIFRNILRNTVSLEDEEVDVKEDQNLQFLTCDITLHYEGTIVNANYQCEDTQHDLIVTMDEEKKEIVDVAYGS